MEVEGNQVFIPFPGDTPDNADFEAPCAEPDPRFAGGLLEGLAVAIGVDLGDGTPIDSQEPLPDPPLLEEEMGEDRCAAILADLIKVVQRGGDRDEIKTVTSCYIYVTAPHGIDVPFWLGEYVAFILLAEKYPDWMDAIYACSDYIADNLIIPEDADAVDDDGEYGGSALDIVTRIALSAAPLRGGRD